MTSTHTCRLLTLAGIGSLLAGSVLAQDAGYFYGGLSVGTSRAKLDESQVAAGQMPAGVISAPGIAIDDRETGFKVFGGYQINRFIGLETGYFSLVKFTFSNPTTPAGTLDGKLNIKGVNFDVVGTIASGWRGNPSMVIRSPTSRPKSPRAAACSASTSCTSPTSPTR